MQELPGDRTLKPDEPSFYIQHPKEKSPNEEIYTHFNATGLIIANE
jgi:hypothetical protein